MKIVVIGGSGFIGSKLVPRLRQRGDEAVAASPHCGVNSVTAEGLAEVLKGASMVVDVSYGPARRQAASGLEDGLFDSAPPEHEGLHARRRRALGMPRRGELADHSNQWKSRSVLCPVQRIVRLGHCGQSEVRRSRRPPRCCRLKLLKLLSTGAAGARW